LGIYRYDVYKSPNIGLFAKTNDQILIVPFGFAESKTRRLREYLQVNNEIYSSVAGTRLIGAMTVMNNNGILLPSGALDEEVRILRQACGLNVEILNSKFTAIGNLISTNDNGAIVSPLFASDVHRQVQDVLGVPVESMTIGGYIQIGSVVVATNTGAGVHPIATEEEAQAISELLQVPVEAVTINSGIPFLSSGMLANSKSVIVGSLTSGPELIMISRVFRL
jgi:translation initiation factor 6